MTNIVLLATLLATNWSPESSTPSGWTERGTVTRVDTYGFYVDQRPVILGCVTNRVELELVRPAFHILSVNLDPGSITQSARGLTVTNLMTTGTMTNDGGMAISTNQTTSLISLIRKWNAMTNVVNQLLADGEVCNIKGHQWRFGRPGEGEGSPYGGYYLDYHPGTEYHTCRLCGKCESKTEGVWH